MISVITQVHQTCVASAVFLAVDLQDFLRGFSPFDLGARLVS